MGVKHQNESMFTVGIKDASFDMALCFDVIEHTTTPFSLLSEINRVLKPNGYLILGTPNKYRISNLLMLILGRKYPYCLNNKFKDDPDYWHITEYSARRLRDLVELAGFSVIDWHRIFYGIPGGFGIRKLCGLLFYSNHIVLLQKTGNPARFSLICGNYE
jgi:SAM-dependent methyltransferase